MAAQTPGYGGRVVRRLAQSDSRRNPAARESQQRARRIPRPTQLIATQQSSSAARALRWPSIKDAGQKEDTTMNKQQANDPEQVQNIERKIQELREAFADAPAMAKTALENAVQDLAS